MIELQRKVIHAPLLPRPRISARVSTRLVNRACRVIPMPPQQVPWECTILGPNPMAKITYWSSNFEQLANPGLQKLILNWVMHAEKKLFPRNEIFDFDSELKKHNTDLMIILDETLLPNPIALIAYLVHASYKKTALLHKVCVLEKHRRHGMARRMLQLQIGKLEARGFGVIKLWVDEKREPARSLYTEMGFTEVGRVKDYYAPGRTGIQMDLSLPSR